MSHVKTSTNKHSHIDTTYNYSSSIIKKANKPLMSTACPSQSKYYPILSTMHLMYEPYCQKCFGMKATQTNEYFFHIFQPHNYACPNRTCSLTFVEQKHLTKHIPICEATSLLSQPRNIRQQQSNKNLINFSKDENNEKENIWISCYSNSTHCATQLTHHLYGSDPKYIDPKNNAPIPINQCYFEIASDGTDVIAHCICERVLIKTKMTNLLENYPSGIICDICDKIIEDITYHCPGNECKTHPTGYDICVTCAIKESNKLYYKTKSSFASEIKKRIFMPPPLEKSLVPSLETMESNSNNSYYVPHFVHGKDWRKCKKNINNKRKVNSSKKRKQKRNIEETFNNIVRSDKNCISNYAIKKSDINTLWLNSNENVSDCEYLRLDSIDLNPKYVSLICPNCKISLQCISLSENSISFMCFNYPGCKYPLNSKDYMSKYIWNNVYYVGKDKSMHRGELLSFGDNNKYMQWKERQDTLSKKLKERRNWKTVLRNNRYDEYGGFQLQNNAQRKRKRNKNDLSQNMKRKKMKIIDLTNIPQDSVIIDLT